MMRVARGFGVVLGAVALLGCGPTGGGGRNSSGGDATTTDGGATGGGATGGEATGGGTTGGGTTGGGATGATDLTSTATQLASALCKRFDVCYGELTAAFGVVDCEANLADTLHNTVQPLWEQEIAAGTVVYSPSELSGCISAIQSGPCTIASGLPPECVSVFAGQVADGEACSQDTECSPTSYCDVAAACPGTCAAKGASGAACSTDIPCATGLVCANDLCTDPVAEGAACEGDGAGNCEVGLLCMAGGDGATICQTLDVLLSGSLGGTCDVFSGKLCKPGLSCVVTAADTSTGKMTWQCVSKVSAGGACHPGFPESCPTGQICVAEAQSIDGTCTPLPAAGAPCMPDSGFGARCAAGLFCDDNADLCVQPGPLGADCERDAFCLSNNCSDGKCVIPALCLE